MAFNKDNVFAKIKRCFPELDGKAVNSCASEIWIDLKQLLSVERKALKEAEKTIKKLEADKAKAVSAPPPTSGELAKWLENPMDDATRSRYVRAAMDMELAG